jgi:hypothetical protein
MNDTEYRSRARELQPFVAGEFAEAEYFNPPRVTQGVLKTKFGIPKQWDSDFETQKRMALHLTGMAIRDMTYMVVAGGGDAERGFAVLPFVYVGDGAEVDEAFKDARYIGTLAWAGPGLDMKAIQRQSARHLSMPTTRADLIRRYLDEAEQEGTVREDDEEAPEEEAGEEEAGEGGAGGSPGE